MLSWNIKHSFQSIKNYSPRLMELVVSGKVKWPYIFQEDFLLRLSKVLGQLQMKESEADVLSLPVTFLSDSQISTLPTKMGKTVPREVTWLTQRRDGSWTQNSMQFTFCALISQGKQLKHSEWDWAKVAFTAKWHWCCWIVAVRSHVLSQFRG